MVFIALPDTQDRLVNDFQRIASQVAHWEKVHWLYITYVYYEAGWWKSCMRISTYSFFFEKANAANGNYIDDVITHLPT